MSEFFADNSERAEQLTNTLHIVAKRLDNLLDECDVKEARVRYGTVRILNVPQTSTRPGVSIQRSSAANGNTHKITIEEKEGEVTDLFGIVFGGGRTPFIHEKNSGLDSVIAIEPEDGDLIYETYLFVRHCVEQSELFHSEAIKPDQLSSLARAKGLWNE